MRIREIIEKLQEFDPEAVAVAYDYDGSMHDAHPICTIKSAARSQLKLGNPEDHDKMTRFVLFSVWQH